MRDIELLAPGGNIESIMAAIYAGADAIYCGLDKLNARNSADNITIDELDGVVRLAHEHSCKIFITLNIMILEQEIPYLLRLLNRLVNTNIDGVIVQDLGLFYILQKYFPAIEVHASTQANTHNLAQIEFLEKLNVARVNLSRELNLNEISQLTEYCHSKKMEVEVFVHGSYCIGFSGLCYMSSIQKGTSGNRGRCGQPCRDEYIKTNAGYDFPLNLKDNSAFNDFKDLKDIGVDSLKIEGRIKKLDYVYTVVDLWRKHIDGKDAKFDESYKVFNRDFSNGFLENNISKDMFINNSRSNTVDHFVNVKNIVTKEGINWLKNDLFNEKNILFKKLRDKFKTFDTSYRPVKITFTGSIGKPLIIEVHSNSTCFKISSSEYLYDGGKYTLDSTSLNEKFMGISVAGYKVTEINSSNLSSNLFISFKEQTKIKNAIIQKLLGKEVQKEVTLNQMVQSDDSLEPKQLSAVTTSLNEVKMYSNMGVKVYYKVPTRVEGLEKAIIEMLKSYPDVVLWFQAVLIGKDYIDAINLLKQLNPGQIVADNFGLGQYASANNIPWIAGPQINIANSYSLKCLKEKFNCVGAFLSNELSKKQIDWIKSPSDFKIHYFIYRPNLLLSSRQCLLQTTSGCNKNKVDEDCFVNCSKSAILSSSENKSISVKKEKREYCSLFSNESFINLDIIQSSNKVSSFFIELNCFNKEKVSLFKDVVFRNINKEELLKLLPSASNSQFHRGL